MSVEVAHKVSAAHLSRTAYLYVRQSTLRQVLENTESAARQYALRQRAIALGWAVDQIVVIDTDQGHSGASSADREGFQRLVAEVGMGRVGIVLGLEVSRLARNNADWHRLLELCSLGGTLICDEDGLYDPCDFNDRLLLGLKGTMSEAELHFIRARLQGGILSKARRGELKVPLPVGLVYDPADRVVLDPDAGVAQAVRHLFATFARTGSARAVVQIFAHEDLLFPTRVRSGPTKGSWPGRPCCTGGCCARCTTHAMRGRSSSAATGVGAHPVAGSPPSCFRASSGRLSFSTRTPATSRSTPSKRTKPSCSPTHKRTARTAEPAPPERGLRCSRVSVSVDGAGGA